MDDRNPIEDDNFLKQEMKSNWNAGGESYHKNLMMNIDALSIIGEEDEEEGLSSGSESPIIDGVEKSHPEFESTSFLKGEASGLMAGEPENSVMESNSSNYEGEVEYEKLLRGYELQQQELIDLKRELQGFKHEYELKCKECRDTRMSLRELQNELMRKSMHVGSLAYAIEGQVKEKSQWFSSLGELTKKLEILKIDHKKLVEEALRYKTFDVTQIATPILSAINQNIDLERDYKDLKVKFIQGAKDRKELYNRVLELKGNIRVFCRCRPLNSEEVAIGASMAIDFESAKDGELTVKSYGVPKKVFKFDSVFSPQADQADVFEETTPFATSVLDGYNVCIFAYGQTGTGKTFTMEGSEESRGVNYRTLDELFHIINDRQALYRYEISVSVLEVYNEQIRDLLVPGTQPGVVGKRLEIRQVAEGNHEVTGLVEAHVSNMTEVWEVLQTGSKARAVGATNANEHSSRSHCIHCVMVKGENLINRECTRSKLWLVDLAGSERIAKTDVQGDRLKETQNINRSLSALGDVIFALATKSPHIPYRNSKLTHLLQDSLGGDSKTLMFVQISPNENDLSETLCSLNFASRVRGIELGPAKKQIDNSEFSKCKQLVEKAKQDMKSKDDYIKKMEDTIHALELKVKTRDLNNKNLQDKAKELESQLLVERRLARQHVDTKIAELQQQQKERHEEKNTSVDTSFIVSTPPGNNKNEENVIRRPPHTENNKSFKPLVTHPPTETFPKINNQLVEEKENNPQITQQLTLPRRAGRLSICPLQEVPAPRRNSLIPFPTLDRLHPTPSILPVQPHNPEPTKEVIEGSSKGPRTGTKKFGSILRRSFQKKVQVKSPGQPIGRRAGINGGTEKVSKPNAYRGRITQKQPKDVQQKHNQKEKEKGWNL